MEELARLLTDSVCFHFELGYCNVTEWMMRIYRTGCSMDGGDLTVFEDQSFDLNYLIAKATVAVKDYLLENCGGY